MVIGDKERSLSPKHLALYAHYAERRRTLPDKTSFETLKGKDSINSNQDEIRDYVIKMRPNVDPQKYKLKSEQILQDISKINRRIEDALGDPALAFYYKITPSEPVRMYGATRYGIHLDKSKIKPPVMP